MKGGEGALPYTESQRRKFHAECRKGDREMCKLAKEADSMPVRKQRKAKR
jgi:hypothetical protein